MLFWGAFAEMTDSLSLLGRAVLGIAIGEKKNWISRSLNKKWGDFSISRKWQPLASKSSITFILQSMFNNALLSKAGSECSTGNRGGRRGIFSPQHFESIILSFRLYIASVRACDRLSVPESGSAHQTEKEIYKRRLRVFTWGGLELSHAWLMILRVRVRPGATVKPLSLREHTWEQPCETEQAMLNQRQTRALW